MAGRGGVGRMLAFACSVWLRRVLCRVAARGVNLGSGFLIWFRHCVEYWSGSVREAESRSERAGILRVRARMS